MSYQVERYVHKPEVVSDMDYLWSQLAEARRQLAEVAEIAAYNASYDSFLNRLRVQVDELERRMR